jgi:tetratricopeptide (TPR) repeat protein
VTPGAVLILLLALVAGMTGELWAQEESDSRVQVLEQRLVQEPGNVELYLALAGLHWEAERVEAAEGALRRGLARASAKRELRWALAQLMIDAERWADAVAALEPLAPDTAALRATAKLRVNLGIEAYRAGDEARARASLEDALREDPTLPEAAALLGQILVEAEEFDRARAVVDAALQHSPGDSRLLAIRSATLEGREGLEAAVEAARAMRRDRPEDEEVGLELARLLSQAGDLRGLVALYDTLLAKPTPGEAIFAATADLWLAAGQVDTAAAILIRGVDLHTGSGRLWERLGDAEWEREEWRDAARAYRMAAVRLPRPERAEMAVADAYVMDADTAAALDALRTMRDRPAPRGALLEVAERAISLGGVTIADSIYLSLLDTDPSDTDALEGAGRLAELRSEPDRAIELYRRSAEELRGGPTAPLGLLRLEPPVAADSARALLRLALWRAIESVGAGELQMLGGAEGGEDGGTEGGPGLSRLEPASPLSRARETLTMVLDTVIFETSWGAEELERLRRTYPRSAFFRRYEADLAYRKGRLEDALGGYDHLLALQSRNVDLQTARAETLAALGRPVEARAAYTRILELTPGAEEPFRALIELHQGEGTLSALLEQVRRLQILHPDLEELIEREIELLHRLDRLDEAREVAKKHQERKS